MHCIVILDIVCLYSFKSNIMVTVVMHSFPFHCHFLTKSKQFSKDFENNKTIYLSKCSIYDHKDFNHVLDFLQLEIVLPPHHELTVL